jgi:hypothetical protein
MCYEYEALFRKLRASEEVRKDRESGGGESKRHGSRLPAAPKVLKDWRPASGQLSRCMHRPATSSSPPGGAFHLNAPFA